MINSLFKSKYGLAIIQIFSLLIFLFLIIGSIGVSTSDAGFAKILRNTNLANLIVWSYWWPLIIVTAIFFGRFWCTICPMEMITSFFGRLGFKKKPGKVLKSGWIITIFYALILIGGIHTFNIHRIPQLMAVYMISLLVVAIIVGLIWEKRTFCTYVCPIGHLLGLYSLLSFKKLRIKQEEVCKSCKTKDCIAKKNHYNFTGRSCTSEIFPPKIEDNRDCIMCGQCHKSCPNNNVAIQNNKRAFEVFKEIKFSWAEIFFFVMLSGFVVYEILSEWKVSKELLMQLPSYFNTQLNISGQLGGTIKALSLFILVPIVFFFLLSFIKKIAAKEGWKNSMTQLLLALLPITASMHLLKALFKTTSRIPYWKFSLADPIGVQSATKIIEDPSILDKTFLNAFIAPGLNIIALLLPILGLVLSFYIIKKQKHKNLFSKGISVFSALLYASVFIVALYSWKLF